MIKKTPKGFVIYSHTTGKRLSKPYATRAAAVVRLNQIKSFAGKASGSTKRGGGRRSF